MAPVFLRCDNHSLAFPFKDGANPPTAPSAACFVPSAESSHLVPASCCQLLPGQLPSQVSNRAHHALWHGRVRSTVLPNAHKPHRSNQPDETQRCCSLSVALLLGRKTCPACRQFKTAISWEYISEVGDATLVPSPQPCPQPSQLQQQMESGSFFKARISLFTVN